MITSTPSEQRQVIGTNSDIFRNNINQRPFKFVHTLESHPLFKIDRLAQLAELLAEKKGPDFARCFSSEGHISRSYADAAQNRQASEAIKMIDTSNSIVFLKSAQEDPEYKAFLAKVSNELGDLIGHDFRQAVTSRVATIIISSPHSATPYHIDHDCNFLFQVKGEKDVCLFDQNDRSVLSVSDIENYYTKGGDGGRLTPEKEGKGTVFHLNPNEAVHHPVLAPHWVKNKSSSSVSLSVSFSLKNFDDRARVYQVNRYLRKLGVEPDELGKSVSKDNFKSFLMSCIAKKSPESVDEVIYSGVDRIQALTRFFGALRWR
jgi:hypothetical protein